VRSALWLIPLAPSRWRPELSPWSAVQVFTSDVDGTAQPYALYVPRNVDASGDTRWW